LKKHINPCQRTGSKVPTKKPKANKKERDDASHLSRQKKCPSLRGQYMHKGCKRKGTVVTNGEEGKIEKVMEVHNCRQLRDCKLFSSTKRRFSSNGQKQVN